MFKIFSFQINDIFNLNNIEKMNGVMHSFLDNINISEFTEEYGEAFSDQSYEEREKSNGNDFIQLKQDDDMYLLNIDLRINPLFASPKRLITKTCSPTLIGKNTLKKKRNAGDKYKHHFLFFS